MNVMQMQVANDNGNSEQDMIITLTGDKKEQEVVQVAEPNVYAKVGILPNLDEVKPEYILSHVHQNLVVSIEGATTYYIGSYALHSGQHCRSIEVGVDNNKVTSDIVFVNTLGHIAGEACAREYANTGVVPDDVSVRVDMATSLPVSYYSRSLAQAFADKFTGREHLVIVHAGAKSIPCHVSFDFVKVIPEGVTASHAFIAENGLFASYNKAHSDTPLDAEDMKKMRILHVAIGEGTTEFPITYNGISFDPNFITGTNNGNGHAIDRVINRFKKTFGLLKLTRQDYSNILRDDSHRYHEDAMEMVAPALEDEAEEILTQTKEVIAQANNNVDVVAVYGGGSILMRPMLEKRLQGVCDRARIKLLYVDAKDAVTLEAVGLFDFFRSGLFQEIKQLVQKKAHA